MPSSETRRRVVLDRTEVSAECIASIISVTKIDELAAMLAETSNRRTLRARRLLSP
jgi:hypothetical protein